MGASDSADRAALGWWLVRVGHAREPRRLDVDPAILDLAADEQRPTTAWSEDADSLATLTSGAALQRAEQLLRGHIGSLETVTRGMGGMVVLTDEFDEASLRAMLNRLAQIGAEVVAVLPAAQP